MTILSSSLPDGLQSPALTQHEILKQEAVNSIVDGIIQSQKSISIIHGGMRAGKTSAGISIMNKLESCGLGASKLVIFRLQDGRGTALLEEELQDDEVNTVFHRSEVTLSPQIKVRGFNAVGGVGYLINKISSSDFPFNAVILLSEVQFCTDQDRIEELLAICSYKGIKVVFDCLDRAFNAMPIMPTMRLLRMIDPTNAYQLCAVDTLNYDCFAPIPARVLRYDLEAQTILPEDLANSPFYQNLGEHELQKIISSIKTSLFSGTMHREEEDTPEGNPGRRFILLPAHPTDNLVVLGDVIYQPMAIENLVNLWKIVSASIFPPERVNEVADMFVRNFNYEEL